jgi:hypothetical protein
MTALPPVLDFQTACISQRGKPQQKRGKSGLPQRRGVRREFLFISNSPSAFGALRQAQGRLSAVRYQEICARRAALYG